MLAASGLNGRPGESDDALTLAALGVLAATVAAVAHETFGHGGACLATGGQVVRLTSIFFRCQPGRDVVDVAGPLAGLACGLAALALHRRAGRPAGRTFALVLAAFALFWFFGQLARDGLMRIDDWAFAARSTVWSYALGAAGIAGYVWTLRTVRRMATRDGASLRRLLLPYVAGAASAGLAGALWRGGHVAGAREGLLTLGVAPLGYVWSAWRGHAVASAEGLPAVRDGRWIAAAAVTFAAFCATQGFGLGR